MRWVVALVLLVPAFAGCTERADIPLVVPAPCDRAPQPGEVRVWPGTSLALPLSGIGWYAVRLRACETVWLELAVDEASKPAVDGPGFFFASITPSPSWILPTGHDPEEGARLLEWDLPGAAARGENRGATRVEEGQEAWLFLATNVPGRTLRVEDRPVVRPGATERVKLTTDGGFLHGLVPPVAAGVAGNERTFTWNVDAPVHIRTFVLTQLWTITDANGAGFVTETWSVAGRSGSGRTDAADPLSAYVFSHAADTVADPNSVWTLRRDVQAVVAGRSVDVGVAVVAIPFGHVERLLAE